VPPGVTVPPALALVVSAKLVATKFATRLTSSVTTQASGLAGLLWEQLGAAFTFLAGIVFCVAALGLILLQPRPRN
jgi:hypothetical protein